MAHTDTLTGFNSRSFPVRMDWLAIVSSSVVAQMGGGRCVCGAQLYLKILSVGLNYYLLLLVSTVCGKCVALQTT